MEEEYRNLLNISGEFIVFSTHFCYIQIEFYT